MLSYIIKYIYSKDISYNILYKILYDCDACLKAKAKRYINKQSNNNLIYKIDKRIHSDIGGPINLSIYNYYRYYITFVDKISRYLFVSLLKSKNDILLVFKKIAILIKNQTGVNIKELFTDNGTEYINKILNEFTTKRGIIHSTSSAYTKEPNGLIERINLTLIK